MWVAVSLISLTAGCRLCATCDDYSGPVIDGTCQTGCGNARAGSILSGMPAMPAMPTMAEPMLQPAPEMQTQPQIESNFQPPPASAYSSSGSQSQYGDVARQLGIDPKMIVSVTDRKVEDSPEATPQEAPQLAEESAGPTTSETPGQPQIKSVKTSPGSR
jgi:hypothetical protein